MMNFISLLFFSTIAVKSESWSFVWPYGSERQCKCKPSSDGLFNSSNSCLEAFAASTQETCLYQDKGVGYVECQYAVSKTIGITNDACKHQCYNVALNHGTSPAFSTGSGSSAYQSDIDMFSNYCDFTYYRISRGTVKMDPTTCFDNWIYGYGDVDPTDSSTPGSQFPLDVVKDVHTASQCQLLCQNELSCVRWSLRLLDDFVSGDNNNGASSSSSSSSSRFQYPKYTCTLYAKEEVEGALSIVTADLPRIIDPQDPRYIFCDLNRASESCWPVKSLAMQIQNNSPCLFCGCDPVCAFRSPYHIAGPRYCTSLEGEQGGDKAKCKVPSFSTTTTTSSTTTNAVPPCPNCYCHQCEPCNCDCFDIETCHCHGSDYCLAARRRVLYEQATQLAPAASV